MLVLTHFILVSFQSQFSQTGYQKFNYFKKKIIFIFNYQNYQNKRVDITKVRQM